MCATYCDEHVPESSIEILGHYEIHDSNRFGSEGEFLSYARLIRPKKMSAGKVTGPGPVVSSPFLFHAGIREAG
jgi:hypothetical protein